MEAWGTKTKTGNQDAEVYRRVRDQKTMFWKVEGHQKVNSSICPWWSARSGGFFSLRIVFEEGLASTPVSVATTVILKVYGSELFCRIARACAMGTIKGVKQQSSTATWPVFTQLCPSAKCYSEAV
mmetsp:Transcript_10431/g.16306  ORF Transcript_10431/g.16306 Transcript_10431/m.16306 type:complete len:126 (+) Transcript_10431:1841-2218(+)